MVDVPQASLRDDGPGGLRVRVEPEILPDHEEDPPLLGLRDKLGGVPGAGRHRLVQHHVLSRAERLKGDPRMEIVGEGDRHDVDVRAHKELPVVRHDLGDVEPLGGLAPALGRHLGDRHDPRAGVLLEARKVVVADCAGSDDGDVEVGLAAIDLHGVVGRDAKPCVYAAPWRIFFKGPPGRPGRALSSRSSTFGSAPGRWHSSPASRGRRPRRRPASHGPPGRCRRRSSPSRSARTWPRPGSLPRRDSGG